MERTSRRARGRSNERIAGLGLGLADKIAVFKALSPSAEEDIGRAGTDESAELRMERLLLSVSPEDLPAFKFARALPHDLVVGATSPAGRGVIVFRTYVEAAVIAYRHAASLQGLITAGKLARVTGAALQELDTSPLREQLSAEMRSRHRQDAEEAFALVSDAARQDPALVDEANKIRQWLDQQTRGHGA